MSLAVVIVMFLGLLVVGWPAQVSQASAPPERLTGSTPAQVAVAIARRVAGGDLGNLTRLVIVSDRSVVDASLAAGFAALADTCPTGTTCRTAVLVTSSGTLDPDTARAIQESRLTPADVMVIGGSGAVSNDVLSAIARQAGWNGEGGNPVARIGGADRYETSLALVQWMSANGVDLGDTALVVNGDRPADLLLAGFLAHGEGALLVLSRTDVLPESSKRLLELAPPQNIVFIGGLSSLPTFIESQVDALTNDSTIERLAGTDRFETSTLVASRLLGDGLTSVALMSGANPTDSLTAGLLGASGNVILFVGPDSLPSVIRQWLATHRRGSTVLIGVGTTTGVQQTVLDEASKTPAKRPTGTRAPECMDIVIETTDSDRTITLPVHTTDDHDSFDVVVSWGDGESESFDSDSVPPFDHTYTSTDEYTINICRGESEGPWMPGFGDAAYTGASLITRVNNFGDLGLTDLSYAFNGASNLTYVADIPLGIQLLAHTFGGATSFNHDIGNWDTSDVTDMSYMFSGALTFNQDISAWNTQSVIDMESMFNTALSFNQDIGDWNTGNVTNMAGMFAGAASFNQDLDDWNTENVELMYNMFASALDFNGAVGAWNVSEVLTMYGMFDGAASFNQDISGWETDLVNDTRYMFQNAVAFNQNIGGWDMGGVQYSNSMFKGASAFNGNIGSWDTSANLDMGGMFDGASDFNQNIGAWVTDNVTNMQEMFDGASDFNQNIGAWDTDNVTNMYAMFRDAGSFNQNIGAWETGNVTNMQEMFTRATLFNSDISGWDTSSAESMAYMFKDASAFDQNLSGWCVEFIDPAPTDFDTGAGFAGQTAKQPVWGTPTGCPAG